MHLCLAQFEWHVATADPPHWRAPVGDVRGVLDLRTLPQQARRGGLPEGHALFVYPDARAIPGAIDLGTELDAPLRPAARARIQTLTGLAVSSATVRGMIRELLTDHADPAGQAWCRPVRISRRRGFEIRLGGFGLVSREPFREDHPAVEATLDVFRHDYRQRRPAATAQQMAVMRRWTGAEMSKLFGDRTDSLASRVLPPEHVADGWSVPETTLTESFNKADSDTLGPDQTWTETDGDIDVVSNEAKIITLVSSRALARCEADLSSDDHSVQINATSWNSVDQLRVLARFSTIADTHYFYVVRNSANLTHRVFRVVEGAHTQVGSTVTGTPPSTVFTMEIEADGSTIRSLVGGVEKNGGTDTAITGLLRTGFGGGDFSENTTFDSFEAADLASGTGLLPRHPGMTGRMQELAGGVAA